MQNTNRINQHEINCGTLVSMQTCWNSTVHTAAVGPWFSKTMSANTRSPTTKTLLFRDSPARSRQQSVVPETLAQPVEYSHSSMAHSSTSDCDVDSATCGSSAEMRLVRSVPCRPPGKTEASVERPSPDNPRRPLRSPRDCVRLWDSSRCF